MGPARDNFCDIVFRDLLAQQTWSSIFRRLRGLVGEFLFQFWNPSVLNLARLGKLSSALRALQFGPQLIELFLPFALLFENGLLLLPFCFERRGFLSQSS